MPYLPHDPSIYIDADILTELSFKLSDRLRRNQNLGPFLQNSVGNHWEEFETNLSDFLEAVALQTGGHVDGIALAAPYFRSLTQEIVHWLLDVCLESCLEILPLHAAAAFVELATAVADVILKAIEPGVGDLHERLAAAEYALAAGNVFR